MFICFYYRYTHGATLFRKNPMRNRRVIPAKTFWIRSVACFFASPLAPAMEYWTPETTSIRTPMSAVIKVAYLMSPRSISMTLPNPGCMVHSYLLCSGPTPAEESGLQSMPGICSVTVTVVPHSARADGTQKLIPNATRTNNNSCGSVRETLQKKVLFICSVYYSLKSARSFRNA